MRTVIFMSWAVKRAISTIPYGVRCEGIQEAPHDIKKAEALRLRFLVQTRAA